MNNLDPNKDVELSLRLERLLQTEMMLMKPYHGGGRIDPNVGGLYEDFELSQKEICLRNWLK